MSRLLGWLACQVQIHRWGQGFTLDYPDEARSTADYKCERCGLTTKADIKWR